MLSLIFKNIKFVLAILVFMNFMLSMIFINIF